MKKTLFLCVAFLAMQVGVFTAQAVCEPWYVDGDYTVYGVNCNGETQLTLSGGGGGNPAYAGTTFSVVGLSSNQTATWSLQTYGQQGDRFYIWPNSVGSSADLSIYANTSSVVRIIIEIYTGSTFTKSITLYAYYQ
jgi:hypothetical protein